MGRTKRKRRRKDYSYNHCENTEEIINLNKWLVENGCIRNNKLVLGEFKENGRGVLTKRKIKPGEELINLPLNNTLNITTILLDECFCSIFSKNEYLANKYKKAIPFQCLLSLYLSYLNVLGEHSAWCKYINILPKNYDVPYFLPSNCWEDIETDILAVMIQQKDVIKTSFIIFDTILKKLKTSCDKIELFISNFNIDLFEWAYFTVNTRCVYMDLTNFIDFSNTGIVILDILKDVPQISLCPFLDMINHSPNARNETKLILNNKRITKANFITSDFLADVKFTIYTKKHFEPYSQVFICYGDSHNLKMVTEYGFCLPDNNLDCVKFDYESIKSFLASLGKKLSKEQVAFISKNSLDKDLYIDCKGLSFSLAGFLMVVKYFYRKDINVGKLIYSAVLSCDENNLKEIILPIVVNRSISIKESILKLKCLDGNCIILNNCLLLMYQYVKILENYIDAS